MASQLSRLRQPSITLRTAEERPSPSFRLAAAFSPDGVLVSAQPLDAGQAGDLFAGRTDRPVLAVRAGGFGRSYTGITCYRFWSGPARG